MATFWKIAAHSVDHMFSLYFDYLHYVISRFGFEGWIWVLIASVPDLNILFRPKKIGVFPLTCRKTLGSVGRKIFLFFYKFLFNKIRSKMFLWVTFH